MREIPEAPKDSSRRVVVLLAEDGEIVEDFNWLDLAELRYKVDYWMGDILAEAIRTSKAVRFSHWYSIPGGRVEDVEPVWCWEYSYKIERRFKVGRLGKLVEL